MTERFLITGLTYIVAGLLPAALAVYLLRIRFLGSIWGASVVGLVGAFAGGMLDVTLLSDLPDLLLIAGMVDTVQPLAGSLILLTLYALVSRSNRRR